MNKLFHWVLCFILSSTTMLAAGIPSLSKDDMESVWQQYRELYPYCFQSVGLKHVGDDCVFVISEPSDQISETQLNTLIGKYNGNHIIRKKSIGHDGWLKDYVAAIRFSGSADFDRFGDELFSLLYHTSYKLSYTDLDSPLPTTYFSPQKLNYSISASSLKQWFLTDKEQFVSYDDSSSVVTINDILKGTGKSSNKLYMSRQPGFIAWVLTPSQLHNTTKRFVINARKFALDCDLIIGAFGNVGKSFVIIGRERSVPLSILPPLRTETVQLLAETRAEELAQSYERMNVFGGKTIAGQDVAPILLSDQLWHTEYGNLLNLTDQMLKSWSENGMIDYVDFDYRKPVNWAFDIGAIEDLKTDNLTYNWNTAGAGYVVSGDGDYDILAVNRTGSLPVSYIPEGLPVAKEDVLDAEELAYDFFSQLENPLLCRVVQYATLYQIFRYYDEVDCTKEYNKFLKTLKAADANSNLLYFIKNADSSSDKTVQGSDDLGQQCKLPDPNPMTYDSFVDNVSRLLRIARNHDGNDFMVLYEAGFRRFLEKRKLLNTALHFQQLAENDPYGDFIAYTYSKLNVEKVDSLLEYKFDEKPYREYYDACLKESFDSINTFIKKYEAKYGEFPYDKAARALVCYKVVSNELAQKNGIYDNDYNAILKLYVGLESERARLKNEASKNGNKQNALLDKEIDAFNNVQKALNDLYSQNQKQITAISKSLAKDYALLSITSIGMYVGTLNYFFTDSGDYPDPFGDFFAEKLNGEGVWMRCPTIVESTNFTGYGGHNLDAHVTPINVSKSIPKGEFKVTMQNGRKVVTVAPEDVGKMTMTQLRNIERSASIGINKFNVASARVVPKVEFVAPRKAIAPTGTRGFSARVEAKTNVAAVEQAKSSKQILINGSKVTDSRDLVRITSDELARGNEAGIKEIRFENYSATEVKAYKNDILEGIMDRTSNLDLDLSNFDVNALAVEQAADGTYVIRIPQNSGTLPSECKAAFVEVKTPDATNVSKVKSAIMKVMKKAKNKINNSVKWHHQLKLELEKMPEIQIDDIKDDYRLIFSHIFNLFNPEYDIYYEDLLIS